MQDAELAGNYISVEEIGKIFVMVNFETDKVSGAVVIVFLVDLSCTPNFGFFASSALNETMVQRGILSVGNMTQRPDTFG